ncbi:protein phosphatase 2C domain-containing protein [Streptomyces sp. NPDC094022]|uniref:protein phosphatase 2C domain-containing protein n=1 Tax=Streptomyces sp. NPDC094022 TaxID=3155206 RepID=UPI0033278ADD
MSQQGGRPTARPEDDWWGQLYDDATGDTGPTTAPDSLDDRFTSVRNTVRERPSPPAPPAGPEVPDPSDDGPATGTRGTPDATTPADIPSRADVRGSGDDPRPSDGATPTGAREPSDAARGTTDAAAPRDTPPRIDIPAPRDAPVPPDREAPTGVTGASDAVDPAASRSRAGAADGSGGAAPSGVRGSSDAGAPVDGLSWGDASGPRDVPVPSDRAAPSGVRGASDAVDPAASRSRADAADGSGGAAPSGVRGPSSDVGAPVDGVSWGDGSESVSGAPGPSEGEAPADAPSRAGASGGLGVPGPSAGAASSGVRRPADAPPWGDPPGSAEGRVPSDAAAPSGGPGTPAAPDPGGLPTPRPPDAPALQVRPVRSARPGRHPAPEPPSVPEPASALDFVGSGPPTYDPEPTALPDAEPEELGELVADTVLDGARYGTWTLRSVSLRGDSARYRGEPRRDALLTARFGTGEHALVLVATATGARATPEAHLAAAEACRWIGRAVGRSHRRLAEDIRATRRADLKAGLHRLTDRSLGRLRASAAERGARPEEYTAALRCLLLPADPHCRTRVFFGVGGGGLFLLRDGIWRDIEPRAAQGEPPAPPTAPEPAEDDDRLTLDLGLPAPPDPYEPLPAPPPPPAPDPFRFQVSLARPGDALLMCTPGLAEPLRGEPALSAYLSRRWSGRRAPGLAAFLADARVRVKGYADDRTAAALWEA